MNYRMRIDELADSAATTQLSDEVADMEFALDPDKQDYKRSEALLALKTLQRDVHALAMGIQEITSRLDIISQRMNAMETVERHIAVMERAIGRSKVA